MYKITSLTITEDILNDKSLSPFEMLLTAIEQQYPTATREQQANALHVKLHSLYEHKRRKKHKQETPQICTAQMCTPQMCTAQISSVQTDMPKSTVQKSSPKNIEEYNNDLDFLMNISSKEEYEDAQTKIRKMFQKHYTESQTMKFDEILSELLQKYGD
jgi:hypothetical protein